MSDPAPTARGLTGVGLASVVAAGAGYGVLVLAAAVLTPARNADFLAYWGLLFFVLGTLAGLQNEVTRSVHERRELAVAGGPRLLPVGLAVGLVLAALVLASSPLWAQRVLGADRWLVLLVAAAAVAFAGHVTVAGALAGSGRWAWFSWQVSAESLVRLGLAALVAGLASGSGLWVAAAAATATWLVLGLWPGPRSAWAERGDVPLRTLLPRIGQALAATASSAAVVVGFPVLIRITTADGAFATAAPLLLAVQLTRAPLLLPLGAYQGMAITHVLRHRDRGLRPLLRPVAVVLGVGVLGAALAALVGPALMVALLGEDYRVGPAVLAALVLAATAMALLTLTGAATLAVGGHRSYAGGWLLATVVTAGLLLIPGTLTTRTVVSLLLGPLAGLVVHLVELRSRLGPRR